MRSFTRWQWSLVILQIPNTTLCLEITRSNLKSHLSMANEWNFHFNGALFTLQYHMQYTHILMYNLPYINSNDSHILLIPLTYVKYDLLLGTLTHCDLVTIWWHSPGATLPVASWRQAISWTNVDLSSMGFFGTHIEPVLQEAYKISICKMS